MYYYIMIYVYIFIELYDMIKSDWPWLTNISQCADQYQGVILCVSNSSCFFTWQGPQKENLQQLVHQLR